MSEFVYCFVIKGRIEWSSETANSLSRRLKDGEEQETVTEFIENSRPGDFIFLKEGTLIFRCAAMSSQLSSPAPKTLMEVLENVG